MKGQRIWQSPIPTFASQQLLAIQMANTGTSTVDGDTKQLFWASRPCIMHCICSNTRAKASNFEI